ncbi:hypothetical protein DERP_005000 [Dermatophagoides pteronyssinus]|uniref:Uncharacterized protein n=1 Tax=Dermatophagoides pteronyssinus TaxID=6956 RepID=A0ABQ8JT67_DERPT|nr:hypothetical protein DERP_005000 [Dermatophagoides pteronyssinus]
MIDFLITVKHALPVERCGCLDLIASIPSSSFRRQKTIYNQWKQSIRDNKCSSLSSSSSSLYSSSSISMNDEYFPAFFRHDVDDRRRVECH